MHSLTSLHTFGLAAHAKDFLTIDSVEGLLRILSSLQKTPYLLLGEGSNTVFTEDYNGLVIKNALTGINISEDDNFYHLNVASGENWHDLVRMCMNKGMFGFENLALIPGSVGASPIQNIGAYGVEIERFIQSVEFVDLRSGMYGHFNKRECEFSYRESRFKREPGARFITSVNFALPKANQVVATYGPLLEISDPTPQAIFDKVIETRKSKLPDPSVLGNAGSFFKNPTIDAERFRILQQRYPNIPHFGAPAGRVKLPAAWLIDQLGFKGQKRGDIACHENQALVLVNHGQGTGEQLLSLAREIRQQVQSQFNISLDNEVRLVAGSGPIEL
ncbi:UDP-N-acetylmuramate dehydrogenase [Glaciecola siphonariae]|uniref:UDP-N-acetylenolpyruvoylglucosamine reductase n=1 Tax=Glaciecola siphonariae TaxID=521012 RepID=A0ABV9M0A2_9ALTE